MMPTLLAVEIGQLKFALRSWACRLEHCSHAKIVVPPASLHGLQFVLLESLIATKLRLGLFAKLDPFTVEGAFHVGSLIRVRTKVVTLGLQHICW